MRKIIAILCLSFITFKVCAQYAELRSGFSFATGSFGNSNKPEDGFATNGNTFGAALHYLFYKNIGICAMHHRSSYGINVNELAAQTASNAPANTIYSISAETNYKASTTLIGPYVTLGKKNLTVDLRLWVGFASLATPILMNTTTFNNISYSQKDESRKDMSAAIGYGITAKYELPKNFVLALHIDNTNATMQFPRGGYQSSSEELVNKPYQTYLISLGLGYLIQ
jgi:hypothetical protein